MSADACRRVFDMISRQGVPRRASVLTDHCAACTARQNSGGEEEADARDDFAHTTLISEFGNGFVNERDAHESRQTCRKCDAERRLWRRASNFISMTLSGNSLRLEISLKKPHRVSDRLRSNRGIKSRRIAGRCRDACAEGGRVEGLCLTIDQRHWLL